MKQYKFRMWACEAEQMCDWESLLREDEICCEKNQGPTIGQCLGGYTDDVAVMQFIGMKDSNGVEIYESDILKVVDTFGDDEVFYKVVYDASNDYPAFDLKPFIDCECNGLSYLAGAHEGTYEVVGNIFENPELLEKVK